MHSTSVLTLTLTALLGASFLPSLTLAHPNGPHPHRHVVRRSHNGGLNERAPRKAAAPAQERDGAWETYADSIAKRGALGTDTGKIKKRGGKTCRVRTASASSASSTDYASATATPSSTDGYVAPSSTSIDAASQTSLAVVAALLNPSATYDTASWSSATNNWGQNAGTTSSVTAPTASWTESTAPAASQTAPSGGSGYLNAMSSQCGWCGSNANSPNGDPNWLNCGLYGDGGWNPPHVTAKQLIQIVDPASHPEVFGACAQYLPQFQSAASQYGVPIGLLMAIGMQESGCNKDAVGARGEQGIMQVAGNACTQSDCRDPWYNIPRGAQILVSEKLGGDVENGNIISALGQYNGWMPGMQVGQGAQYGPQGQTIAYLDDMFNKWMQGKSAY